MSSHDRLSAFLHAETPQPPVRMDPHTIRICAEFAARPRRRTVGRGALVAGAVALVVALSTILVVAGSEGAGREDPGASVALTPSIPALFRSPGAQHCGNPYAVTATTTEKTIPLADCPGFVGLNPVPVVTLEVGARVLVSGLPPDATATVTPDGLLTRSGSTYTAMAEGSAVLTVRGVRCAFDARTCQLVKIEIS